MKDFYKRFVREELDEEGKLLSFELDLKDDFNFSYDVVDELGRLEPDKVAILWVGENGEEKRFTYKDIMEQSSRVANMMLDHGVKKGDFVLAVLKRHYEFWFLAYGLMKIGAILVPATNQLTTKDYVYRFKAADISYVVTTGENGVPEKVDAALKEYGGIKEKFITHGSCEGWTDFLSEIAKYPAERERISTNKYEPMLMYFSSGTTGYPKMALHNYTIAAAHILTGKHWHHLDENSLHLTVSETGWAKCAWGKMFGQYVAGATTFIYDFDRFDPDKLMQMIQDYRITSFCAPPTMYRFFIKAGMSKYDLSSIKYSCIAGEALTPTVYRRWFEYTGLKLMEGFGQTESAVIVGNLFGMEPKAGSMGKPTPLYKVALMDSDGELTPQGEVGEIVVYAEKGKTPGLLKEYYRNPAENERAWKYGVYHTGDTAYMDKDGYYWYVGRTDDLIKASGYRIGPFEIESILMEHAAVMECAVTAAADPIRGNVVKATIVLTKDYEPSEELVKELQDFVKKSTAPYKYPRIIEFVDELPKTHSGKIRRAEIRRRDLDDEDED